MWKIIRLYSDPFIPSEFDNLFIEKVSHVDNDWLCMIQETREIKLVVWSMGPLKSLGLDGMP